jgi:macrolide transport system ATP-binding/permease protein
MRLFRVLRRKSDLAEELESHLRMAIADRIARGNRPLKRERWRCANSGVFR